MLTLPIKEKWFNMILSGEKKEEYREIKPYYDQRFCSWFGIIVGKGRRIIRPCLGNQPVMFRNGYSKNSPSFIAMCSVEIGTGKEEWGAEPDKKYYVLKIHEITERKIVKLGKEKVMVKDIINGITEKYYNESEEYYSEYRYDEEENEYEMKKEIEKALTEKGAKFIIKKRDGFSSCGYDNDFLAIAYIENEELGLETILLERM